MWGFPVALKPWDEHVIKAKGLRAITVVGLKCKNKGDRPCHVKDAILHVPCTNGGQGLQNRTSYSEHRLWRSSLSSEEAHLSFSWSSGQSLLTPPKQSATTEETLCSVVARNLGTVSPSFSLLTIAAGVTTWQRRRVSGIDVDFLVVCLRNSYVKWPGSIKDQIGSYVKRLSTEYFGHEHLHLRIQIWSRSIKRSDVMCTVRRRGERFERE